MNVDVFNSVTSPNVLSLNRCVLHFFLTMPVASKLLLFKNDPFSKLSGSLPATLIFSFYRLYEVCDVFNGRSPKSLTSLKLLLAVSKCVMVISITFVQCEEDETTSWTFFSKFSWQISESILLIERPSTGVTSSYLQMRTRRSLHASGRWLS